MAYETPWKHGSVGVMLLFSRIRLQKYANINPKLVSCLPESGRHETQLWIRFHKWVLDGGTSARVDRHLNEQ